METTTDLHVMTWGAGTPVVFLHGLGASGRYWDEFRRLGDDSFTGMAVDLLGFGRSPKPADETYDIECHLRHLLPVLPERAVVVGHSAGAVLALALAVRFPERVHGLVLVSLPAYPDAATARREIARLNVVARLTVDEGRGARVLCWIMCRFRLPLIAIAPILTRGLPAAVARDGLRHTYASYTRTLQRVVVDHHAAADLDRRLDPTVLVHGRDDHVVPVHHVEELASPRAHVSVVAGDHHLPIHNPRACAAALRTVLGTIH
jgi:pimeloyl-ACP methyl ester carboxylesterase